jgi:hypothetical protein
MLEMVGAIPAMTVGEDDLEEVGEGGGESDAVSDKNQLYRTVSEYVNKGGMSRRAETRRIGNEIVRGMIIGESSGREWM